MKRKAVALLIIFIALIPLSFMVTTFFTKIFIETKLTSRYVGGMRAFWTAEAGVARAQSEMRTCALGGNCTYTGIIIYNRDTYVYNAAIAPLGGRYYRINSTGSAQENSRQISAVVQVRDADPGRFENGIETQGDIDISGNARINPAGSAKSFSVLNFEELFGFTKDEVKTFADTIYVDPPNNVLPCDGIIWVEVNDTNQFRITEHNWRGSGILIINGDTAIDVDATITGGTFDGIIYIIGELEIPAGNPVLSGTVLVEDEATDITKLRGNLKINYDPDKIENALNLLRFIAPHKVAWWEPEH